LCLLSFRSSKCFLVASNIRLALLLPLSPLLVLLSPQTEKFSAFVEPHVSQHCKVKPCEFAIQITGLRVRMMSGSAVMAGGLMAGGWW
jgi:hypothetical protein